MAGRVSGRGDADRQIGLDLEFDDGSVAHEVFNEASEVDDLLSRLDVAIAADEPVVEFRGKKLAARPELRAVLETPRRASLRNWAGRRPEEGEEEAPKRIKSKAKGPLVYENIDDREYQESAARLTPVFSSNPRGPFGLRGPQASPRSGSWLAGRHGLAGKHGALLADDMGLGKTLQALTFLAWLIEKDPFEAGISIPKHHGIRFWSLPHHSARGLARRDREVLRYERCSAVRDPR